MDTVAPPHVACGRIRLLKLRHSGAMRGSDGSGIVDLYRAQDERDDPTSVSVAGTTTTPTREREARGVVTMVMTSSRQALARCGKATCETRARAQRSAAQVRTGERSEDVRLALHAELRTDADLATAWRQTSTSKTPCPCAHARCDATHARAAIPTAAGCCGHGSVIAGDSATHMHTH
jgi:hypothetical protein